MRENDLHISGSSLGHRAETESGPLTYRKEDETIATNTVPRVS